MRTAWGPGDQAEPTMCSWRIELNHRQIYEMPSYLVTAAEHELKRLAAHVISLRLGELADLTLIHGIGEPPWLTMTPAPGWNA